MRLVLILSMILIASETFAKNLCEQESAPLIRALKTSERTHEGRQRVAAVYHSRREVIAGTCSNERITQLDAQFQKFMGSSAKANRGYSFIYKPRKTVEIGTIYFDKSYRQ